MSLSGSFIPNTHLTSRGNGDTGTLNPVEGRAERLPLTPLGRNTLQFALIPALPE